MLQQALFGNTTNSTLPGKRPIPGAVYETSGRAREYRELACNLYVGCDHRCRYCYVPTIAGKLAGMTESPRPRQGILEEVRKSAKAMAEMGDTRQVLFSFLSDPYQEANCTHGLTRRAIAILHDWGIPVCILSKGGHRAMADLDLLGPGDSMAATLTFLDDVRSQEWEPGAAPPEERLEVLEAAHARHIPTWVSIEPVIDPRQSLACIQISHKFVDEYKIGIMNYMAEGKGVDWPKFGHAAVALCDRLGKAYYLKHDLRKLM